MFYYFLYLVLLFLVVIGHKFEQLIWFKIVVYSENKQMNSIPCVYVFFSLWGSFYAMFGFFFSIWKALLLICVVIDYNLYS